MTPLLGLDIIIKNSLNLQVEHDLQHVLVNPEGDKTQLEHMGRHLYLIACPSQHGLSPCFTGSLSQVIGFLPADKELHEQMLASRSSSSTDLDEDPSKQQVAQNSLNFCCQHVLPAAFDEKDNLSFELVPSKGEVADSGGELQSTSFHPYQLHQQEQPSTQERELHNMNHIPFQPWCVVGQEAKGKASTKTSNIHLSYAYIRQPQETEPIPVLTWVESLTGLAGSMMTTEEGTPAQQLDAVVTFIKRQGLAHSTLQCDGEPALVKLVEEIGKQTSLPTRQSPAYSQPSEAWQKSLFTQFRALLFDFCRRYKLQPSDVKIGGSLSQHLLSHAVWLLNRFQLQSDNKTSFQRRWGIAYSSAVLPFGELVLAQDQSLAIWLGRCKATDQHILAKANSSSLVKSNSVTRLSLSRSRNLTTFQSISLPPPELASAAYLKMAKYGDQPSEQAGGARELRLEYQSQAYTKQPQQKAKGRHKQQPRAVSFQLPPGLAQPPSSQDCPYELADLAWQQPALQQPHELQPTALHPPVAQQLASATTALTKQDVEPPSRRQPSEEQASQHQPVRRSKEQKGTGPIASKLHSILEKARTFQEIELAVNSSEAEAKESKAAVQDAHLKAYFEDDLSLFPAEEIKKAKLKEGESLRGTYEQVSRASLTAQQLQHVIQTTWAIQERSSAEGEASLKARIVDNSFKQQILDLHLAICASTPSHMSLKILLTLSLINKWDVITADLSSALVQAPTADENLVLVQPPPELEQNTDVLWQRTRTLYGIKISPKLWQQYLAGKLEALGLRKNKVDPCIFASEQLIVMHHLGALLVVGDKSQQESFIDQLSANISLKNTTKLDAKTPLTFLGKTLEYNPQEHSISLCLPASYYLKLFKMYGMQKAKATSTTGDQLGQSEGLRNKSNKTLASARHKLYRTAVGQLLWATPVRPDISFAVKELSRNLQAPTRQDEQQLKQVLRYLKGSLHFTISLQPQGSE